MKKLIVILFCFGIIQLSAQMINFNLSGAGARAMGMGGAFIGVADDATAIAWNPAGLAQLERTEISVVTRFISDTYEVNWDGDKYEDTQDHFVLNFLSAALPINVGKYNVVGAIALQRQIDLYTKGNTSGVFNDRYDYEGSGGVDSFTFGGSFQALPWVSFGVAANLWMGSYEYKEDYGFESGTTYRADYKYTEEYSGFNLVTGLMINLNGLDSPLPIKFGSVFRTPFELNIEASEIDGKSTEKFDMPSMVGFGVSIQPAELFTIAADYEMRYYSEVDFPFDMNQLRIGTEYMILTDFAVIPLRAGFFTHPTFMEDENGDQVSGVGISLGTGLIFERFALDLGLSANNAEIEYDTDFTETFTQAILAISAILYF